MSKKTEDLRVAFLMLTWNKYQIVPRTFQSLEKAGSLRRPNTRWLICDNASTDGTAQWLMNFVEDYNYVMPPKEKLRAFFSTRNRGVSGGRDFLLRYAPDDTDIIVFLDDDVAALEPNWIEHLLMPFTFADRNVGVTGPGAHIITKDAAGHWDWFKPMHPRYFGPTDVVSGYCQAFTRKLIDQGFKMDHQYGQYWMEDSDLCLWAIEHGFEVIASGQIGLKHLFAGTGDHGDGRDKMRYMANKWKDKPKIDAWMTIVRNWMASEREAMKQA